MAADQYITGLDLGSHYIKASSITGRNGDIIFSAYGESQGIEDGKVTDSVRLLSSIRSVLRKLEIKTGSPVTKVFLNVDTAYTRQEASRGTTGLKGLQAGEKDLLRAVKSAMRVAKASDEAVCDVLIGEYKVDGVSYANPLGVGGNLLDVTAQTILGDRDAIMGQARVLQNEGIQVLGTGLSVHGMANLMLNRTQRYRGALLVDCGHRKTDVVVLRSNRIVHSETIPLGGRTITKDISIVLKISMNEAEELKKQYGSGKLERSHPKYDLISDIVKARVQEILTMVMQSFQGYPEHAEIEHSLVYGGGMAGFNNLPEMGGDILPLSTNYMTSDIIKSDDIFTLNATGCAFNMIHELQSGLIAELWETTEEAEVESEEDEENYFSIFDKVRQKAGNSVKQIMQDDDDGYEPVKDSPRTAEDFRRKASEHSISSKLKKLFGIE